ncbi:sigma-70 family RNA polymerase sigma factor [Conexibacter sp. W3-3-2]|uniref:RNA polymerase subunit sigma-24 n=1 Tax=Paraconexibacter algicola TaxID=2133960 RepID=A0A2T4UJN9_9ACTN|nr:sigma-70 family RNA polymerase sigma factor [Conexibacter sp. W3-3-2]PTL59441.1 RNA polymerase subunit sigma-24 [Paraconexibacter algicola]
MALPRENTARVAFDALYRQTVDDVYAYVVSLLRDRSASEDVTAAVYERAYRRRSSYRPDRGSERAWLFGIARNAALDELRRRSRTAALVVEPDDPDAAAAFDAAHEETEAADRRATVRAAVARLEARDRELIALKFHAGLTNVEIAGVLGISEANAGTRIHRAVTKLREACS